MGYMWSPSKKGFYPITEKAQFIAVNEWPTDGVAVTTSEHDALFITIPGNKQLGTVDGHPEWVDIPPPAHEESMVIAGAIKQSRIDRANDYMNGKQWPGKAALGRLKADELKQYGIWLDYLDALEATDLSTLPDIAWPPEPVPQS